MQTRALLNLGKNMLNRPFWQGIWKHVPTLLHFWILGKIRDTVRRFMYHDFPCGNISKKKSGNKLKMLSKSSLFIDENCIGMIFPEKFLR